MRTAVRTPGTDPSLVEVVLAGAPRARSAIGARRARDLRASSCPHGMKPARIPGLCALVLLTAGCIVEQCEWTTDGLPATDSPALLEEAGADNLTTP